MEEANEQLLRDFLAAFESGDVEALRRIVDPAIVDHTLPYGAAPGIDGLLRRQHLPGGVSDLRITVDEVVSRGDRVVGYGRITGTNSGPFFGMPPTGRSADFGYLDIYRVEAGRITETWHLEDIAGLMRQLAPQPEPQVS